MKKLLPAFLTLLLVLLALNSCIFDTPDDHTHTPADAVKENVVEATADSDGSYDLVIYCSECGEEISRETKTTHYENTHTHTPADAVKENIVAPTVTTNGSYDLVVYCSECGAELSRNTHTHTPAEAAKENYNDEDGTYEYVTKCSECGEEISRIHHDTHTVSTREENRIEATAHEDGSYDLVTYCAQCGYIISRTPKVLEKAHTQTDDVKENIVSASGNSYGSYDIVTYCTECDEELYRTTHYHTAGRREQQNVTEATPTTDGSYDLVIYCAECEEEISRETKTTHLDHTHTPADAVKLNVVLPSETSYGSYDLVVYCSECGAEISRDTHYHTPAEAAKDNYNDEDGTFEYVINCSECGEELSRKYHTHTPKDGVLENRVDATAHEDGSYDIVIYCSDCGHELSRQTEILTRYHTLTREAKENIVDATPTANGSYDLVTYCAECDKELSRTTVTTYYTCHHTSTYSKKENIVEATKDSNGSYDNVIYCSDCGKEIDRATVITYYEHTHTPGTAVIENGNAGFCDFVTYCTECGGEISREHHIHSHQETREENKVTGTYKPANGGTPTTYDLVTYCTDCGQELSRTPDSHSIQASEYYSQFDYLELSANVNSLDNLVDNGGGTYTLTAKTNSGKEVRLFFTGKIESLDGGWGKLPKDTQVYSLDAVPGVNYIAYDTQNASRMFLQLYYDLYFRNSVDSYEELVMLFGNDLMENANESEPSAYADYFALRNYSDTSAEIVSMKIYYCNTFSEIVDIQFYLDFYQLYVPGEVYDTSPEGEDMGMPIRILFQNKNSFYTNTYYTAIASSKFYSFGDIKRADGTEVTRQNRILEKGDQIKVTAGNYSQYVDICADTFTGKTFSEAISTQYFPSTGTQKILVIPITFADQQERMNDKAMQVIYKSLGNVISKNGTITTYSFENGNLSLSAFLNTSSYGKLTVNSYVTDVFCFEGNGLDYFHEEFKNSHFEAIEKWLKEQNIDLSQFDQNGDGYIDAVIFINTLDYAIDGNNTYNRVGMSGAFASARSYYLDYAGTSDEPNINGYLNLPLFFLYENFDTSKESGLTANVLIHEFGHRLGMTDYYDNNGATNVLGGFDMECDNVGDWNSYTKYALGWIEPTVIDGKEDSYAITIGSYATTGNAIVIRRVGYDGNGTPFDEYIIIDLFAHDGLYASDSASFGLENSVGVRIYHINSVYEQRTYEKSDGTTGIVGTMHLSPDSSSKYASSGKYLIEMIQNGNVNEFVNGGRVSTSDLFYEGDKFSVSDYSNFFCNGLMDNGEAFGYKITIKNISTDGESPIATILIEKVN